MKFNLNKAWEAYSKSAVPDKLPVQRFFLEGQQIIDKLYYNEFIDKVEGNEATSWPLEYVVIAIDRSRDNDIHFWRKDGFGYTTNPFFAGIFTTDWVLNNPNCNDGYNAIAIPITTKAFRNIQFNCKLNLVALNILHNAHSIDYASEEGK